MNYILRNKNLEVKIDHPLENYRSSRFDWTGKVSEIRYRGKTMTITEKPDGENENIFGKGLFNEFSMDTALGFDDAEIGEWFHKIGIGLLRKDGPDYEFFKEYEIKPAHFDVFVEVDRVKIECISAVVNDYAYILRKEFILRDNRLDIKYSLENSGKKDFEVEEYVHNFMAFSNERVDSDYTLKLPFKITRNEDAETLNPDTVLDFVDREVTFNGETENQFFASYLNGLEKVESKWELIHSDQNIGVSETASFPTNKVNLWGWKHVISPELFHEFQLKPGETEEWIRTYHFFELD